MPDAVLVREQRDVGSVIDGDIVGGRMGLLTYKGVLVLVLVAHR